MLSLDFLVERICLNGEQLISSFEYFNLLNLDYVLWELGLLLKLELIIVMLEIQVSHLLLPFFLSYVILPSPSWPRQRSPLTRFPSAWTIGLGVSLFHVAGVVFEVLFFPWQLTNFVF